MLPADKTSQMEAERRLEQIKETIEFLQNANRYRLTPQDYEELEEAILKVWVRSQIRDQIESMLGSTASDIHVIMDESCRPALEDVRRHVYGPSNRHVERRSGRLFGRFVQSTPERED